MPPDVTESVEARPSRAAAPPSREPFHRRLAERIRPEDVAALLAEDCITEFGARRALYAAVDPQDGSLAVRLTFGFDGAARLRWLLSAEDAPPVRAALHGAAIVLDAAEARALLGDEGCGDLAPAHAIVVPLVALPLVGGPRTGLEARCPLYRHLDPRRERCFLQRATQDDPMVPEPWETRVRTLCPDCTAFGATGVVLAERHAPFEPDEIEHLEHLGIVAGQRCRALEMLERQERAFDKLKKDREWMDTVIVSAADPIVVTDLTNALVLQNRRAEELLVAGQRDSEGKRRAIAINDLTFSAYLSSLSIDAKRAPRELPLVHPIEGSDLLFEVISTPAYGATGQRIGWVTVMRDITDLQRVTQELYQQVYKAQKAELSVRQERDRLNLILRSAVDPIVVTNAANDIVLANREGERLFQASPGDDPRRINAVVVNDATFSSFLTEFMTDGDVQRKREVRLHDPASGEVRSFEVTAGKITHERGGAVAIVSVFHDVTKLRELERRRLEQKLFESEKLAATGRLAASIAHEMNNPLESIKNSVYLIKSRIPESDPASKFLAIAQKECDRVSNIIRQFLGFYRPGVTLAPVDLSAVLEYELKLLETQLEKHGVTVRRRFGRVPRVMASEDQLKQVFLNLILNAMEAMPRGGELTLETHVERGAAGQGPFAPAVRATVADNGPGISSEHLQSIFEPFFTTKSEKGTGLGLWVSYGIVKSHNGDIKVETEPGRGTKFHVILPARPEPEGSGDGH